MSLTINEFFAPEEGLISRVKKNFSPRGGQADLSKLISGAIDSEVHVIAEAETGFGKSFAVLVPAIVQAIEHGKRIVISTETLALQDQYMYKDLPLLHKACELAGRSFAYAAAKGKNNYVCRLKVEEDEGATRSPLMKWARDLTINDSGDVSDITIAFEPGEWWKIACDDDCAKKACPFFGAGSNTERGETECFAYQARRDYNEAQIVVANHTLVLLDAKLGTGVLLGPYDVLIVDEAHSMPERAQDAWGTSFKPRTISSTITKIGKMLSRAAVKLQNDDIGMYRDLEDQLFNHFDPVVGKGQSLPMEKINPAIVAAAKESAFRILIELTKVRKELSGLTEGANEGPIGQAVESARESLTMMMGALNNVFGENLDPEHADNWLSFVEIANGRHGRNAVLHIKPIQVAPLMKGMLLDKIKTCVFLSATMRINGSFHFMKRELGMPYDKTVEFYGESPFDYASSVTAYCPRELPACDRDNEDEYLEILAHECIKIIKKMQGKTMILFTNAKHMKEVYYKVFPNVKYECLLQGTMSKNAILDHFRDDIGSCLFATRSFFTGVDVPGEALSCVVLIKCPFRVPDMPLFQARCGKIKEAGGNDFTEYSLPLMLFDVRQAFGRLIRTINDKGLFCFLDSRAMQKSYWSNIRAALPKGIRYIQNLERLDAG